MPNVSATNRLTIERLGVVNVAKSISVSKDAAKNLNNDLNVYVFEKLSSKSGQVKPRVTYLYKRPDNLIVRAKMNAKYMNDASFLPVGPNKAKELFPKNLLTRSVDLAMIRVDVERPLPL